VNLEVQAEAVSGSVTYAGAHTHTHIPGLKQRPSLAAFGGRMDATLAAQVRVCAYQNRFVSEQSV